MSKTGDFWSFRGNIPETVGRRLWSRLLLAANRKSHTAAAAEFICHEKNIDRLIPDWSIGTRFGDLKWPWSATRHLVITILHYIACFPESKVRSTLELLRVSEEATFHKASTKEFNDSVHSHLAKMRYDWRDAVMDIHERLTEINKQIMFCLYNCSETIITE